MRTTFEDRFKSSKDEHTLLLQLTQLKKEIHEPMRDFVAKFNKIIHKIPATKRPNGENRKGFFVNAMPPNISFNLRRNAVADIEAAQRLEVELEDDLLAEGKWKKEIQNPKAQSLSSEKSDPLVQKLINDVMTIKKQLPKMNTHYQDIPRKYPGQSSYQGEQFSLTSSQ